MKKFILGKKIGMTQVFLENGNTVPVTVIQAGPCVVIQKKTIDNDGYTAVRLGFTELPAKKLNKPDRGIFDKLKVATRKYVREFRTDDIDRFKIGQEVKAADMFADGDRVDVSGISKGKGFQGVIKRYGQSRGAESHGSMYHRRVGSMGAGTSPGRVFKGKKQPGHMGAERVTVQNLDLVRVDNERNLLLIKGAVPGPKGGLVIIKGTVKSGR